jgi:hypothetical protein
MQFLEHPRQLQPNIAIAAVPPNGLSVLRRSLLELVLRDERIALTDVFSFELGCVRRRTSSRDHACQRDGADGRSYTIDHMKSAKNTIVLRAPILTIV